MKTAIILLLGISAVLSEVSLRVPITPGIRNSQTLSLTDGMNIAIESNIMEHFYMASNNVGCSSITTGRCGSVYGLLLPLAATNINILNKYPQISFTLVKGNSDFFCLKSTLNNAFLSLEGQDCMGLSTFGKCGRFYLYKLPTLTCTDTYGFRITMIHNNYVLQSVRFPNIYLYFKGDRCNNISVHVNVPGNDVNSLNAIVKCGYFVGHLISNINTIAINDLPMAFFVLRSLPIA